MQKNFKFCNFQNMVFLLFSIYVVYTNACMLIYKIILKLWILKKQFTSLNYMTCSISGHVFETI